MTACRAFAIAGSLADQFVSKFDTNDPAAASAIGFYVICHGAACTCAPWHHGPLTIIAIVDAIYQTGVATLMDGSCHMAVPLRTQPWRALPAWLQLPKAVHFGS